MIGSYFIRENVEDGQLRTVAASVHLLILELCLLLVPWGRLFVLMRDAEDGRFIEVFANQLDANGHAILIEAAGER